MSLTYLGLSMLAQYRLPEVFIIAPRILENIGLPNSLLA